jgi:FemAB-related protein (PEP-CTERM system-associated)
MLSEDATAWDAFVGRHPGANLYHLSCWKGIIERSYGHSAYFLFAVEKWNEQGAHGREDSRDRQGMNCDSGEGGTVAGVLPLVHMKHFLFGNRLISLPYFDLGGILARDEEAERALLSEAIRLGSRVKADCIELRHAQAHRCLDPDLLQCLAEEEPDSGSWRTSTRSHKVRMLLDLPATPEDMMQLFKSKLRSQIRKPQKEGLTVEIGGVDLLDEFYNVFTVNMRDLGSPVHSKKLMHQVLTSFGETARIVLCRKDAVPVGCSLIVSFGDTLYNPWASSLREYSMFSPNMLLYWSMLEYAIGKKLSRFDFGRSTPGEGTYRFKEQWGSVPQPLNWQFVLRGAQGKTPGTSESPFMKRAIRCWQKLPVPVTRVVGPVIRKQIDL